MHDPAIERLRGLLPQDEWDRYHGLLEYAQSRGGVDGRYHSTNVAGQPISTPVSAPYDVSFTQVPMGIEGGMGYTTQTSPTSPGLKGMELLGMVNLSHRYPEYGEKVLNIVQGDVNFSKRARHNAAYHDAWRKRKSFAAGWNPSQPTDPMYTKSYASTYVPASGRWFRADPRIETDQLMDEINAILASRGFAEDYPQEGYPFSNIVLSEPAAFFGEEVGEEEEGAMPYPGLELHEFGHEAYAFFEQNPDTLVDAKGKDITYYNPVMRRFESVRDAIMDKPSVKSKWNWVLKTGKGQASPQHLISYAGDWRERRRTRGKDAPVPLPEVGTDEFNKLRSLGMALDKIAYDIIEDVLEKNRMRGRTASGM